MQLTLRQSLDASDSSDERSSVLAARIVVCTVSPRSSIHCNAPYACRRTTEYPSQSDKDEAVAVEKSRSTCRNRCNRKRRLLVVCAQGSCDPVPTEVLERPCVVLLCIRTCLPVHLYRTNSFTRTPAHSTHRYSRTDSKSLRE